MNIIGTIKFFLDDDYAYLKYSEARGSFAIDTVMVPVAHRGTGIGAKLISHVLVMADAFGKKVKLSARPIGTVTEEKIQRLIEYYGRFGFEVEDRGTSVAYMVREAQTKKADDNE